jgi:hypothetical protein
MMESLSESALAPAPAALASAMQVAEGFKAKGIGLNGSYFLWGIARGLITAGDRTTAGAMLNFALQVAAGSGETRMNPEIWMLQSEIETDQAAAVKLLSDAYHLAEAQGAVANALRAATAIMLRSARDADSEWARATLDVLDGRVPVPADPRWMHHELAHADALILASHAGR